MLDYQSLAALSAVIREGTFDRGAASLGITPSAISQRIRGLEERLGTVLVVRSNPCVPTEVGASLCAHVDRVRLLELDLAPSLGIVAPGTEAPARLGLAVNADSLATWFPAAVLRYQAPPHVSLDLTLDDETMTADRLRTGEVMAAVTAEAEAVQGCKTLPLGRLRYVACATPEFVSRHFPSGIDAEAIASAPHVRFDRKDDLQASWARMCFGAEIRGPAHRVPSTHAFLEFVVAGIGWGLKPETLVADHLEGGRLVELHPHRRLDVPLYWTSARIHSRQLRRLTGAVCEVASERLVQ